LKSKAVYIPIHLDEQHWICAVILNKTNELIIYNDFGIKESHRKIMNNLLDLVVEEFRRINHKHSQSELNTFRNKWSKQDMSAELPQQTNGYDCGVFTFLFMAFHSHGFPITFTQNDIYNYCNGKGVRFNLAYMLWKSSTM